MATNHHEYYIFYGGTNEWVRGLASKVNKVADASKLIAGIDVSHHNDPKSAESKSLRNVQNPDDRETLKDFIHEHSEGWLVLTKNGSVFEKGYGESLQRTMDAFETEWKNTVRNSGDFGNSFKEAFDQGHDSNYGVEVYMMMMVCNSTAIN